MVGPSLFLDFENGRLKSLKFLLFSLLSPSRCFLAKSTSRTLQLCYFYHQRLAFHHSQISFSLWPVLYRSAQPLQQLMKPKIFPPDSSRPTKATESGVRTSSPNFTAHQRSLGHRSSERWRWIVAVVETNTGETKRR